MWTHYLINNLQTGLLGAQIDIPAFSWSRTVSDSSMRTKKNKGTGTDQVSNLTIPWTAIPADTPEDRNGLLMPGRAGVTSFWDGVPFTWGMIGQRRDSYLDTSFAVDGIQSLLARRYLIREGIVGVRPDTIFYRGLSLGTIAKRIVQQIQEKPAGVLPIDFQADETAADDADHQRSYHSWDVQNINASDLLTKLSNVLGGPDIGFRPVLADSQHVRLQMVTGTEASEFIGQDTVHEWASFPGGGSLEDLHMTVSSDLLTNRVIATGSGQDEGTLVEQAEDFSTTKLGFPLFESSLADTSTETVDLLRAHARANLAANRMPIAQLTGTVRADGPVPLGQVWPGDQVILHIDGFPSLPDGTYRTRVMEMSGDQTPAVKVTFDVMEAVF